jgi:hypothetical protein
MNDFNEAIDDEISDIAAGVDMLIHNLSMATLALMLIASCDAEDGAAMVRAAKSALSRMEVIDG